MKNELYTWLLLFMGLLLQVPVQAQSTRMFNPLKDEIDEVIPPLAVLLDSAYSHDPGLKTSKYQILIEKSNLKTNRGSWTQNLGLQANVGYGTFNYFNNSTANPGLNQNYITQQSQTQYQFGGWLNLPLSTITNHRNQVRQSKFQIGQSESQMETIRQELEKQVIRQYYEMIANQRILKIKSTYLETARINMEVAEKSFQKGTITIDEYSRVSEIESRTESDYETARMNFLTAYQTLQVMVGIKFNLNSVIPPNNEGK